MAVVFVRPYGHKGDAMNRKMLNAVCLTLMWCLATWESSGRDMRSDAEILDALNCATNYWLTSLSDYHDSVSTNLAALCKFGRMQTPVLAASWFDRMFDLPLATNDIGDMSLWLREKVFPVWAYGEMFASDSAHSNLWLRLADFNGMVRNGLKTQEEIRVLSHGDRGRFLALQDESAAFQFANESLKGCVVDCIGKKGIALLPEDMRFTFFTNYVQRAVLTAEESAAISNCVGVVGWELNSLIPPVTQ